MIKAKMAIKAILRMEPPLKRILAFNPVFKLTQAADSVKTRVIKIT